jgi:hypothetical protein
MAKIKVTGVKELAQKLDRNLRIELNKIFRDKELRDTIGDIAVKDIKETANFGPPAPKTLKWRKIHDPINTTDPAYQRGKLNIVFTGELLEDLRTNVKGNPTELSFELAHSNKRHKKYRGKNGLIGSQSTYKEISEGLVNDLGYDYFDLSDSARQAIIKELQKSFYKVLSSLN